MIYDIMVLACIYVGQVAGLVYMYTRGNGMVKGIGRYPHLEQFLLVAGSLYITFRLQIIIHINVLKLSYI